MSEAGGTYSDYRAMLRTVVLCLFIAAVSIIIVVYLRLNPIWENTFKPSHVLIAIPVLLLDVFFATTLLAVANRREMGRNVSGWFDVVSLMIAEGILAYLILGSLLSTTLFVLICIAFVAYLHYAQGE
jgi:uncharacterized membrane protein YhaH (DUF805 family)